MYHVIRTLFCVCMIKMTTKNKLFHPLGDSVFAYVRVRNHHRYLYIRACTASSDVKGGVVRFRRNYIKLTTRQFRQLVLVKDVLQKELNPESIDFNPLFFIRRQQKLFEDRTRQEELAQKKMRKKSDTIQPENDSSLTQSSVKLQRVTPIKIRFTNAASQPVECGSVTSS